jgi:hypothetical protein
MARFFEALINSERLNETSVGAAFQHRIFQ